MDLWCHLILLPLPAREPGNQSNSYRPPQASNQQPATSRRVSYRSPKRDQRPPPPRPRPLGPFPKGPPYKSPNWKQRNHKAKHTYQQEGYNQNGPPRRAYEEVQYSNYSVPTHNQFQPLYNRDDQYEMEEENRANTMITFISLKGELGMIYPRGIPLHHHNGEIDPIGILKISNQ